MSEAKEDKLVVVGVVAGVFRSRHFWIGVGIFLLAILVRGVYLYESSDNPAFRAPLVDSKTYDQMARSLVKTGVMTSVFFWQQFFYPFFLSVIYFFSGSSIVFAKVVQVVLGSVTVVLTYRLGERIFGRAAGVLAGCMTAFYGPLVFFEAELLAAGWSAFWSVLLIFLFLKVADKKSVGVCFALGLCGALSVITRPNFLGFLLAGCVWLFVVWGRERLGAEKLVMQLGAIAVGFGVVAVPVADKNYRVTGRFSILPATGGVNIYIGNHPEFEAVSIRPGTGWEGIMRLPLEEGFYTDEQMQQFFYSKAFENIRAEPMSFLRGMVRKSLEFTSSREMPGNIDIYLFRRWSHLLDFLVWKVGGFGFPFGVLLPLGVLGLIVCWRKVPVVLIVFCVLYPASVVLTHVEARYRAAIIGPMCVLAGAGLVGIVEMVRMRRWRSVLMAGVFGVGIGFLCSAAGPFYTERIEQVNYEAELYYGLGSSLGSQGRLDEAIDYYHRALEIEPNYAEAYNNLGVLLLVQKKSDEAVVYFDKTLQIDPEHFGAHANLARVFRSRGRVEDAISEYLKALQIRPYNIQKHYDLGDLLLEQSRFEEALVHFRRVVQIRPDFAEVHYKIGRASLLLGRLEEASSSFRQALQAEPGYAEAHNDLGEVLAGRGEIEDAISHFRQAIAARPAYAEAYNNLGALLSAQGKLDEAIGWLRRAVQIDPGHIEAHSNLGVLLWLQGKLGEAIVHFRRVQEITPDDVNVCINLGKCLERQGQVDEAAAEYRKALAIEPEHKGAREALERLKAKDQK